LVRALVSFPNLLSLSLICSVVIRVYWFRRPARKGPIYMTVCKMRQRACLSRANVLIGPATFFASHAIVNRAGLARINQSSARGMQRGKRTLDFVTE
jgi:hypothetical protein